MTSGFSEYYSWLVWIYKDTWLFSLTAPSRDAPVYIEQKSNMPSNTGLKQKKKKSITLKNSLTSLATMLGHF